MSRPISPDLKDFSVWLIEHHFYARPTCHTMASNVRRILREVDPLTTEGIDAFLGTLRTPNPARCAWKRFVEWAWLERTYRVPMYSPAAMSRLRDYTVPDPVCEALETITKEHRVPIDILLRLRWRHTRAAEDWSGGRRRSVADMHEIDDPTCPGSHWTVASRCLKALEAWGQPETDASPLVPVEPKSDRPMSVKQAKSAIRNSRKMDRGHDLFD